MRVSGLIYLVGAVVMAAVGLGVLWFVQKAPLRDSLKGVDEFKRARMALKKRERPYIWRDRAGLQSGTKWGNSNHRDNESSTVKVLR
ncbi:MAG: hypothetical protein C4318_06245 [Acidimicrobiia bacterium]